MLIYNSFVYHQNRVALIGHSAGAHLAMLTVLELCLKRLESNPSSLSLSRAEVDTLASSIHTSMDVSILNQTSYPHNLYFVDTHFNGKNEDEDNGGGDGAKASFVVVKDEGNAEGGNGGAGESFYMVDEKLDLDQTIEVEKHEAEASEEEKSLHGEEERTDDTSESTGDVVSNVPQEIPKDAPLKVKEERESSIDDLLSPIKLVIGEKFSIFIS